MRILSVLWGPHDGLIGQCFVCSPAFDTVATHPHGDGRALQIKKPTVNKKAVCQEGLGKRRIRCRQGVIL